MGSIKGVLDGQHRATTLGIVLGMSLVAFESLAVATIAPRFAESLGGMGLYGWVFSSFLLMSLLGITVAGQHIDRHGPGPALVAGLSVFAAGLLVSGLAPTMPVLLAGRALQGLGGGAISTALYASVNLAYPDALRPRMMALLSTAWVLPTLVGPALAGVVADAVTWRAVFLGIVPLLAVLTFLVAPTFRQLRRAGKARGAANTGSLLRALRATGGAALFLIGLNAPSPGVALVLVVVGALVGVPALRGLLPRGTLTARRGLAAVVASRALFAAAFAGVQVFLSVLIVSVQGYSSSVAGLVIASGSVSWTLGTWLQERQDKRRGGAGRQQRLLIGTLTLALGTGVQLLALMFPQPLHITVTGLAIAGLGIGVAHATASVLAFSYAPAAQEGRVSSALQLADQFAPALSTGAAGALFAAATRGAWGEAGGVGLAVALSLVLALLSAAAARRAGTGR